MHLQYSIYAPSHGQRRSYGVTERIAYCYYAAYSRLLSKNLKIFPVVLHGSEACSLALREERRLRVFENRILKQIFVSERDANGESRRLHDEGLHSLYRSPNVVRVMKSRRLRWAGHVARIVEGSSSFKMLTGTTTGKRPLERPRR